MPEIETILREWALPEPVRTRPLAHGTNNEMFAVETPAGAFVLRVYANHADVGRVRFEQAVLARLAADGGLPFALPVPLPTASGAPFARIASDDGEGGAPGILATLAPLLPGAHPDRGDLEQARAGGEALGLLDVALARLPPIAVEGAVGWRSYGDLAHCHPLVPDPRPAILELPVAEDARERLVRTYDALLERILVLYAALPRQLTHEDYSPDNLLMEGARVTAVLDFEFCALDLRAMDLTVALSWWPGERFGMGDEWPILRAVAAGYGRHIALTSEEAQAMPTLYLLRAYTSLVHRLGRHRQGLSPMGAVTDRAYAAIAREDWVETHGGRLVDVVLAGADADAAR
ncbi:MAG TPA: phosphotransferase [Ktedonobacterales bacterium]|nr:phosphotransferase [Ktedonobacterales bacterium]